MNILSELKDVFREALSELCEDPEPFLEMICRNKNPELGDYQANFCMPLGKQLGRSPKDIANEIINKIYNK